MKFTLSRKARPADRSRRYYGGARERVSGTIEDGMVVVRVNRGDTVNALRRDGFRLVEAAPIAMPAVPPMSKPKPVASVEETPSRREQLRAMRVTELRDIAKERSIKGRSRMNEDALIEAIVATDALQPG